MAKPRIGLFTSEYPPYRGGIGTYARETAAAARDLGCEVTVYAPAYDGSGAAEAGLVRFPGGVHSYLDFVQKARLVRDALRQHRFDVLHAADWPFYLPVALTRFSRGRRLVTLHGSEAGQMARPMRAATLRLLGFVGRIDGLICNSHFTRDLLLAGFPEASSKAVVSPLGVSGFWTQGRGDRAASRARFGFEPGELVVVTTGRMERRKGHDMLLDALAMLPDALRTRVRWMIIGPCLDAEYVRAIEAKLPGSGVAARILGEQPSEVIRTLYRAADLFALTGVQMGDRVEGFGLVYLEAGGCGLPAVATRTGGVADAVADGVSGLLVEPAGITAALAAVLGDDALRARLSEGAVRQAEHLSWRRSAAQTYGLQ